jgi:hypothetical protein
MCVRLCVRRRFCVLIDWRNRPGQSDSVNKKSPTKNRLCLLSRRAWKPRPGQSDSETGNRPGQSDFANKKSPTKNRLCLLPRRAWKPRGGIYNACILKDKFSLGPVHCPCWEVMTGVIEWEFSLSGQRRKIHGKLLRIYERIYETMVNGNCCRWKWM